MAATKATPVQDYLWNPSKIELPPFCVVFGEEYFLKTQAAQTIRNHVLQGEDAEFSFSRFEGKSAVFRDVLKEASTTSMFGGGLRLVLVEEADPFVTRYRAELEDYAEKPSEKAILLLLLKTLAANTRLYKVLLQKGLLIEAKPMDDKTLPSWIVRWAKQRHGIKCEPDAAALILQRIGPDHGMLDQELAKLALMVPGDGIATLELVDKTVGSWRVQTVFQMLDTALIGRSTEALQLLDSILLSGEKPMSVLNRISPTLRKFAAATEKILEAEKHGRKLNLTGILKELGFWPSILEKSEKQLRYLGRHRGAKLRQWLLQADLDLKGASKINDRHVLETLIVRLSDPSLRLPSPS